MLWHLIKDGALIRAPRSSAINFLAVLAINLFTVCVWTPRVWFFCGGQEQAYAMLTCLNQCRGEQGLLLSSSVLPKSQGRNSLTLWNWEDKNTVRETEQEIMLLKERSVSNTGCSQIYRQIIKRVWSTGCWAYLKIWARLHFLSPAVWIRCYMV